MKQATKYRQRATLLGVAFALCAAPLAANAWSQKPVRVVVPAPAGGTMDVVARVLSEAISTEIGQPVIVDNKPGAGGAIGVQGLNLAPPDGQTIMVIASNILTEIPLVMKTGFDPVKDVKPVTMVARSAMVLVATPTVPAKDLKGLIGYLKTAKGGQGSYASYTAGTSSHYAGAIFASKSGLDLQHVPFPGSPPALQNVMGGQVDIMFDGAVTSLPLIKAGKLKAFGVGTTTRLAQLPDVPTMAEQGFPEIIDFSNWVGVIVSSRVPDEIVNRINAVVTKVASTPKVREKLMGLSFSPMVSENPEALARMTHAEYERNAQIVKAYNIKFNQ
ncbi:Bug family tripartite tricarboxylate transporter substrate binding protein [Cupriavidus basilensis]